MNRIPVFLVAAALAAPFCLPAAATPSEDRQTRLELADAPCSLTEAVTDALAATPGTVSRARLVRSRKPGEEPVWFHKVVIFDEASERHALRFDARSCEPLELAPPTLGMDEAIETALLALGGGLPVAGRLRFPGLEPVYRVVILGPHRRWVALVDGISGEVLALRPWKRRVDEALDRAGDADEDASL